MARPVEFDPETAVVTLIAEGARVFGAARHVTPELAASGAETFVADLAQPGGAEALVAHVIDRAGGIDILVNNAGAEDAVALAVLTKSLAEEFGPPGARINTVSPGAVKTSLWTGEGRFGATVAAAMEADHATFLDALPGQFQITSGRITEVGEVADLIAFLVSARAANILGADYVIDGGSLKAI